LRLICYLLNRCLVLLYIPKLNKLSLNLKFVEVFGAVLNYVYRIPTYFYRRGQQIELTRSRDLAHIKTYALHFGRVGALRITGSRYDG